MNKIFSAIKSINIEKVKVVISIVTLLVTIVTALIAIASFNKTKEIEIISKRPKITLSGLFLYPDRVETYAGKNVNFGKSIKNTGYEEIIAASTRRTMSLERNNKKYMFVNLCHEDDNVNNKLISFDVLNIELSFDTQSVFEFKIKNLYSIISKGKSFGNDVCLQDLVFPVTGSTLEIPVAYAATNGQDTSLLLEMIDTLANERVKRGETLPFDFMNENEIDQYIGFIETAYSIECRTIEDPNVIYDYTFLLKTNGGRLVSPKLLYNGSKYFHESAYKASGGNPDNIIQKECEIWRIR